MKTVPRIAELIESRLKRTWFNDVAGGPASWPFDVALGRLTSTEAAGRFGEIHRQVAELRRWANGNALAVRDTNRLIGGTAQPLPTHVTVPDVDTAAAVCGPTWTSRIKRGRSRGAQLRANHPGCRSIPAVVRDCDRFSDIDFELLITTSTWFADHDATGLTPRQVPVPGVHAKWLNTGRPLIESLIGRSLGLAERHPARLHFTYLDPGHIASGLRRFDSATVGDTARPMYAPQVVIITENKDTAIHFPATPGAVAVEGAGYGGTTAAAFDWIVRAPLVVYWGDLDADGFAILDGYRNAGVPAVSICMDCDTYRTFAPWGTHLRPDGRQIQPSTPKALTTLTDSERSAYHAACAPVGDFPPRIEQERIPLDVAREAVLLLMSAIELG